MDVFEYIRKGILKGLNHIGQVKLDQNDGTPLPEEQLPDSIKKIIGTSIEEIVSGRFMGLWNPEDAPYFYNQIVLHENMLWFCNYEGEEGTNQEPFSTPDDDSDEEHWTNLSKQTLSSMSSLGWVHTITFSAGESAAVTWAAGVIKLSDDTTFDIVQGTTGDISANTWIYFDINVSETTLQTSTNKLDAVGLGKILIGFAQLDSVTEKSTFFDVTGESTLTAGSTLLVGSLVGNLFMANTIKAGHCELGTFTLDAMDENSLWGTRIVANEEGITSLVTTTDGHSITIAEINDDIDLIQTTQTAHSTSISQNAYDINLNATSITNISVTLDGVEDDVDDLYNVTTTNTAGIGVNATAITLKADQTVVDNLNDTVTSNSAAIIVNATNITHKITQDDMETILSGDISGFYIHQNNIPFDEFTAADALAAWEASGYNTYLTSSGIYTGSVATNQLSFVPVDSSNIVATLQASNEGLVIDSSSMIVSGDVISGGAITGVKVQTGTSGQRVILDNNMVTFFDSSENSISLYGYLNTITCSGNFSTNAVYTDLVQCGGMIYSDGFISTESYLDADSIKILGDTVINSSGDITVSKSYTLPTADGSSGQYITTDGSGNLSWDTLSGSGYTHPTYSSYSESENTSGSTIIDTVTIITNSLGHVTNANVTTRTLSLANLGFTGDTNANYYTDNDAVDAIKADDGQGLNSDTLDGYHASSFALASHSHTGYAASSHTHSASAITSGTFNINRIPTGTTGTTVALGNHDHDSDYAQKRSVGNSTYYFRDADNTVVEISIANDGTITSHGFA